MRHLKDYKGDGGIERLLLEIGLSKGRDEDYRQAEALVESIPDLTLCEMLRAVGVEAVDAVSNLPVDGYREAWLAMQAAAFRKNTGAD